MLFEFKLSSLENTFNFVSKGIRVVCNFMFVRPLGILMSSVELQEISQIPWEEILMSGYKHKRCQGFSGGNVEVQPPERSLLVAAQMSERVKYQLILCQQQR